MKYSKKKKKKKKKIDVHSFKEDLRKFIKKVIN